MSFEHTMDDIDGALGPGRRASSWVSSGGLRERRIPACSRRGPGARPYRDRVIRDPAIARKRPQSALEISAPGPHHRPFSRSQPWLDCSIRAAIGAKNPAKRGPPPPRQPKALLLEEKRLSTTSRRTSAAAAPAHRSSFGQVSRA